MTTPVDKISFFRYSFPSEAVILSFLSTNSKVPLALGAKKKICMITAEVFKNCTCTDKELSEKVHALTLRYAVEKKLKDHTTGLIFDSLKSALTECSIFNQAGKFKLIIKKAKAGESKRALPSYAVPWRLRPPILMTSNTSITSYGKGKSVDRQFPRVDAALRRSPGTLKTPLKVAAFQAPISAMQRVSAIYSKTKKPN